MVRWRRWSIFETVRGAAWLLTARTFVGARPAVGKLELVTQKEQRQVRTGPVRRLPRGQDACGWDVLVRGECQGGAQHFNKDPPLGINCVTVDGSARWYPWSRDGAAQRSSPRSRIFLARPAFCGVSRRDRETARAAAEAGESLHRVCGRSLAARTHGRVSLRRRRPARWHHGKPACVSAGRYVSAAGSPSGSRCNVS